MTDAVTQGILNAAFYMFGGAALVCVVGLSLIAIGEKVWKALRQNFFYKNVLLPSGRVVRFPAHTPIAVMNAECVRQHAKDTAAQPTVTAAC